MKFFIGKRFIADIKDDSASATTRLCECVVVQTADFESFLKLKIDGYDRWLRRSEINYVKGLRRAN